MLVGEKSVAAWAFVVVLAVRPTAWPARRKNRTLDKSMIAIRLVVFSRGE